jgi:hypothetical protein
MRTVDNSVNSPYRNVRRAALLAGQSAKGSGMIVNLLRREDDNIVLERIEGDMLFEGGAAAVGVAVTFQLDGRETVGRIVRVAPTDDSEAEPIIEVEEIDQGDQDVGGEVALANLPPGDDTSTKI